jgi:hypothetical protein
MPNHKRKLSTYNFTVFDMATMHSCGICGEKTVAERSAKKLESCLLDFIGKEIK